MQPDLHWAQDARLHAALDFTLNGGKLGRNDARAVVGMLQEQSAARIEEYVGQRFFRDFFPTTRVGGTWKAGQPHGWIDHFTAGIYAAHALMWFSSQPRGAGVGNSSAHFIIARNGTTISLADPLTTITWHARSNNYTHLGCEMINAGLLRKTEDGYCFQNTRRYPAERIEHVQSIQGKPWEPYTSAQIVSNIVLKRVLLAALPTLKRDHFTDHQAVDPERKIDTGPLWPLENINNLVFSGKRVRDFRSLEPTYLSKNAVTLFNAEVSALLTSQAPPGSAAPRCLHS